MSSLRTVLRWAALLAMLIVAATAVTSGDILDDWDSARAAWQPFRT